MKETQKSNLLCSLNESRHYCQGYILTSSISPQSVLRFKKYNQSLPLSFQAEKYYNFFPYNLENTSTEALSRCISISYLHYQSHQFTFLNFVSVCMCVLFSQSCPTLCGPLDCSPHAPLSMGFSRQGYWSGLPFPSPGDLPDPGTKPGSPALQADSLQSEPPGKPHFVSNNLQNMNKKYNGQKNSEKIWIKHI